MAATIALPSVRGTSSRRPRRSRRLRPARNAGRPSSRELAALDDAGFRRRFSGSALKRVGRDRFVRNVLIAIGNSGAPRLLGAAAARLGDASPLVRAMAVWAVRRLAAPREAAVLEARFRPGEPDPDVEAEWEA